MKHFILKYFLLILVSVAGMQIEANAAEPLKFAIYAYRSSPKFYLSFPEATVVEKVSVKIRRADTGKLLFSDHITTDMGRLYNLRMYGSGNYEVEVSSETETESRTLSLGEGDFVPLEANVRFQKDRFEVIYLNESGKDVHITLFDQKDRSVLSLTENAQKYRRSFDLSKLEKGHYTLRISDGKEVFEEVVTVE